MNCILSENLLVSKFFIWIITKTKQTLYGAKLFETTVSLSSSLQSEGWGWKILNENFVRSLAEMNWDLKINLELRSKCFSLSFQLLLVHGSVWSSEGWVGDIQCGCWGCCQHRRLPGWLPRWPVSGDSSCLCSPLYKYLNTDWSPSLSGWSLARCLARAFLIYLFLMSVWWP